MEITGVFRIVAQFDVKYIIVSGVYDFIRKLLHEYGSIRVVAQLIVYGFQAGLLVHDSYSQARM